MVLSRLASAQAGSSAHRQRCKIHTGRLARFIAVDVKIVCAVGADHVLDLPGDPHRQIQFRFVKLRLEYRRSARRLSTSSFSAQAGTTNSAPTVMAQRFGSEIFSLLPMPRPHTTTGALVEVNAVALGCGAGRDGGRSLTTARSCASRRFAKCPVVVRRRSTLLRMIWQTAAMVSAYRQTA